MLLKNSSVLSQESGFFFCDNVALSALLLSFEFLFLSFSLALSLVDDELLLPQTLDFALVFQLAHATSLCIHLLKSVILCEFLHELALELFLHAFLFLSTFSLESELVFTSGLKFLTNADALLRLCSFLSLCSFLRLLHVQVIPQLLLEHFLSSTLLLFSCKLLEDLVTNSFSLLFHRLDFVLSGLLLLCVPSDHLVFILIHLPLAFQECTLLVLRKNHVGLRLLFLLLNDTGLLVIFFNHALHDSINLLLLTKVLLMGLLTSEIRIINLLLN